MKNHLIIGQSAETLARKYLIKNGLTPICRNYLCKYGEIDLIMKEADDIVFIEVRCRSQSEYGSAAESVTSKKIRKLIKTATHYLQYHDLLHRCCSRFDIIGIDLEKNKIRIEWLRNAFLAP